MTRVLVCGGRDFDDAALLENTLNEIDGVHVVIHGASRGADTLARQWAQLRGIAHEPYPAQWERDGKAAGPIRNRAMLVNGRPDIVVAFSGGRGTQDCVKQAESMGIRVVRIGW